MKQSKLVPKLRFKGFNEEYEIYDLGSLVHEITPGKTSSKQIYNSGEYPVYDSKGITGYNTFHDFDGDFILLGRNRGDFPSLNKVNGKFCVDRKTLILKPIKLIDINYLFYYLQSRNFSIPLHDFPYLVINPNQLKKIKFTFPSINEQKMISKFFTAIDNKINLLNKKHREYIEFKKYFTQEIFSEKIKFDGYDDWITVTLDQLFDEFIDFSSITDFKSIKKNFHDLKNPNYDQLIEILGVKNKYNNHKNFFVDKTHVWKFNLNNNGIILLNIDENIGELYFLMPQILPFPVKYANRLMLRSNNNIIFKYYLLSTDYFKIQLNNFYKSNGRIKINKQLKKIKINIPQSIEEQQRITLFFMRIDDKLNLIQQNINNLKQFKDGALHQTFVNLR